MIKINILLLGIATAVLFTSCKGQAALEQALKAAGENRPELERVLVLYADSHNSCTHNTGVSDTNGSPSNLDNTNNSGDPDRALKLRAAKFLIENMPGHYTYAGDEISEFYEIGEKIFTSTLDPHQQNDSIARLVAKRFPRLRQNAIQDITIIKSDYLIKNIEDAFTLWRTKPWARHLDFEQFCEYLLPYKVIDGQPFDHWRDTLAGRFGNHLAAQTYNDENYDSPFHASQLVRRSLQEQVVAITGHTTTPAFLSASTIYKLTYGWCSDYALLAVAAMRSLGVPVVHFNVPQWGRNRVGHDSYALLNDRGESLISPWDFSTEPGGAFFINERIPKIYHTSYSINRDREEYHAKAKYRHPFGLFQRDATNVYLAAVDVSVPVIRRGLKDKYVYIAMFNSRQTDWNIIDFGMLRRGHAEFRNMGRNVVYLAFGYDGRELVPISHPFILHTNGSIETLAADHSAPQEVTLRRKYGQRAHVADMQRRLLDGQIQAANEADFSDHVTLYTIENLEYPDMIPLAIDQPYRYWRYLSPNGSWGSIAELQFFCGEEVTPLNGQVISSLGTDGEGVGARAFDGDWFTNFETDSADGSWVGLDMGRAVSADRVRCIPRTDDNYVRAGDEYELCYWDAGVASEIENREIDGSGRAQGGWRSLGRRVADDNFLHYSDVPSGALLWLRNYTRGVEERVFTYRDNRQIWW